MSWLSKLLGYVPAKERVGISLCGPAWEVPAPEDPATFLRAIDVIAPAGSVLYLEGGCPIAEMEAFLAQRVPEKTTKVELGTIWPRPEVYHMAITPGNLEGLAELAAPCDWFDLAVHMHVYKGADVLLEWYDVDCRDPMWLSQEIPAGRVRAFCERLGVDYGRVKEVR